ncbi:methyltransferase domain-containing protein [Amycolatopsis acidicola]|nr:methyltransferase domain-containing protein [Amycolatopsis acidicola]
MSSTYFFQEAWPEELARLTSLEAALDPGTKALLEPLSRNAKTCLEAGAGAGSIAGWLGEHIPPPGRVLACDIQTKFLERMSNAQLEIRRHDIAADALPADSFDLVHVRWTLFWLAPASRAAAVAHLLSSLRPEGRLLVEEPDFAPLLHSPMPAPLDQVITEHARLISERSPVDVTYGRRVYADLTAAGLRDTRTAARTHVIEPGRTETGGAWLRLALNRIRPDMVRAGMVTEAAFDVALRQFDEPNGLVFPLTMAVWGQK